MRMLKKVVYCIGKFFVNIGSKMMNYGSSYKTIYSIINKRISLLSKEIKKDSGKYIENSIKIVDKTLSETKVDSKFYKDYYSLQKNHIRINSDFIPGIIAVLTSITITILFEFINKKENEGKMIENLEFILLPICAILLVGIIVIVSKKLRGIDNCIIEPYIIKKMKEKIDKHNEKHGS